MILKLEQTPAQEEIEVLIKYEEMNSDMKQIITLLNTVSTKIKCASDSGEKLICIADIYYIESVDKKTFVYCENAVLRTELRLYQVMEKLAEHGFVQINKACILNLNVLNAIKPMSNSRMEAILKNSERLNVSRKYLSDIRKALQEGADL